MEKSKFGFKYWTNVVAIVLGIISFFMLFLPSMRTEITATGQEVGVYNGFQTMFGYTEKGTQIMGFSFINFLGSLFIVLGVIVSAVNFLLPNLFKDKKVVVNVVAIALFVVGGIITFGTLTGVVLLGNKWALFTNTIGEGPIIEGILALLSAASLGVSIYAWNTPEEMNKKIEEAIMEKIAKDAEESDAE